MNEKLKLLLDDLESVSLEMHKLCNDYFNDDLSMTQFSMASARLYSLMKQLKNLNTKSRCPCGGVIYANTEDWKVPVCYECYEEIREYLIGFIKRTEAEPRCDRCTRGEKHYHRYYCHKLDDSFKPDFYCKNFKRKEDE